MGDVPIADPASASTRGPVYADGHLVVIRTAMPPGLRLAGEIDINNSGAIARSLLIPFPDGGDLHLDLTSLIFCDISGIRALVTCSEDLGPNRRLLLHGLPDQLAEVIRVTGWADRPGLVICECGVAAA